jgi:hypothetical protein
MVPKHVPEPKPKFKWEFGAILPPNNPTREIRRHDDVKKSILLIYQGSCFDGRNPGTDWEDTSAGHRGQEFRDRREFRDRSFGTGVSGQTN